MKKMETNEFKNPTDRLKLQMIKRVILLVFGCVMMCGFFAILPGLLFASVNSDAAPIPNVEVKADKASIADKAPIIIDDKLIPDVPEKPIYASQPIPVSEPFPIMALIVPVTVLVMFGFLAFGIYDLIRLSMHYRWMKERDDVMFP